MPPVNMVLGKALAYSLYPRGDIYCTLANRACQDDLSYLYIPILRLFCPQVITGAHAEQNDELLPKSLTNSLLSPNP